MKHDKECCASTHTNELKGKETGDHPLLKLAGCHVLILTKVHHIHTSVITEDDHIVS